MIYKFKDTQVNYKFVNRKTNTTNVYLHGWGCDFNNLLFCEDYLKNQNSLYIDFPPFGKSGVPIDWTIFTYVNMVISLCEHLKLNKLNLVGHSFGGRVAILVSILCKDKVDKLVLIDSAGLKPKRDLTYYWKIYIYKLKKKLKLDVSKYGSCDYIALDANMKRVFNNIVNTHLDEFLPFVKAKTLIVFGEKDTVTPIYMAKRLNKKIKNSKLILLKNAGHFSFVDKRVEFVLQLQKFINKGE